MMKMKNLNGTSREGTGVNYKEGVKLLDIESSDSDSQEHFSLPPLELKGARKKKTKMKSTGSTPSSGGGGGCGSCCCKSAAIVLLVVALLSTTVIGYFTYRLQAEVRTLKDKLAKVESWSQDNPNQFHNLHSNVQDINKDIKEIKSQTENQLHNITDIFKQIGQLNTSTLSLKNSLAQAPELRTLPNDVHQVQEQLIKIGSDLETLKANTKEMDGFQSYKDSITEQLANINTRLNTLETKPSDESTEPSASSRELNGIKTTLKGLIEELNFTLTTRLNKMSQDRELQMAQFASLRNRTLFLVNHMDELDTRVTNAMDPSQTRAIISEEINKLNVTSGNIDSTALQDVRLRVTDIAKEFASFKPQQMATSENVANLTRRIDALSTQMEKDMQVMTESMGDVKVTDLKTRLDEHDVRLRKLEDLQTPGGAPTNPPTVAPPAGETVKPAGEVPGDKVTQPMESNPRKEQTTDGWSSTPVPLPTKSPENLDTQAPPDEEHTMSHGTPPSDDTKPQLPQGGAEQTRQQGGGGNTERTARGSHRTSGEDDPVDSLLSALEKENRQ